MKRLIALALLVTLLPLCRARAQGLSQSILNTPHNLSASGPGAVRATSEQQICIFCHTPHHSSNVQPIWNRRTIPTAYKPYTSNSLDAQPGQPTGSSKLCLSCHDGTIALGNILSRQQTIAMAGGMTTLPPNAKSNLGTDLSDDHPISFRYDSALAAKDPKLKDPRTLPQSVKLDSNAELQCTSCHDPHNNTQSKFLVMNNESSQLCNSCHKVADTTVTNHQQCAACHQQHTAPSGPYLLVGKTITDTCTKCHGATTIGTQSQNVFADLQKFTKHDTNPPVTQANRAPSETNCIDCHGPHTMKTQPTAPPLIPGIFGNVPGVNIAGSAIAKAQYEYEVCFRCHSDRTPVEPVVSRQITNTDVRLEFSTGSPSYHPVVGQGRNTDVPSLRQQFTTASIIYCNDCHSSDSGRKAGGSGAEGTHGSNIKPLLLAGYDTRDRSVESANTYALCYRCHDRASVLADQSFPKHKLHVVDQQTPCSVCHDPHGIPQGQGTVTRNSHLINFDTSVVTRDPVTTRMEFEDLGSRSGKCYLSCHGKAHSGLGY